MAFYIFFREGFGGMFLSYQDNVASLFYDFLFNQRLDTLRRFASNVKTSSSLNKGEEGLLSRLTLAYIYVVGALRTLPKAANTTFSVNALTGDIYLMPGYSGMSGLQGVIDFGTSTVISNSSY